MVTRCSSWPAVHVTSRSRPVTDVLLPDALLVIGAELRRQIGAERSVLSPGRSGREGLRHKGSAWAWIHTGAMPPALSVTGRPAGAEKGKEVA
jgi:hypothetical protein